MVLEYLPTVILGFSFYFAFSLPVIAHERGLNYWKSRSIYHILIFSTGGIAILFIRSPLDFVLLLAVAVLFFSIHRMITNENAISELYDFMRRDGVTKSERSLYTASTNILLIVLAIIHWDTPVYYTIALLTMAFSDKMGEFIGRTEGEHEYELATEKTVEGSIAVFITSSVVIITGSIFGNLFQIIHLPFYLGLAVLVMISEAVSIKFLDNVLIPYIVSFGLLYLT